MVSNLQHIFKITISQNLPTTVSSNEVAKKRFLCIFLVQKSIDKCQVLLTHMNPLSILKSREPFENRKYIRKTFLENLNQKSRNTFSLMWDYTRWLQKIFFRISKTADEQNFFFVPFLTVFKNYSTTAYSTEYALFCSTIY